MNLISRGLGSAQLFGLRLWLNGNFAPCHLQKICGNYAASYRQTNKTAINLAGEGSDGVQGSRAEYTEHNVVNCAVVEWILLIVRLNVNFHRNRWQVFHTLAKKWNCDFNMELE